MQILLISYNGIHLSQFFEFPSDVFSTYILVQLNCRYSQAGTPVVKVASSYNAEARTFSLKFRYINVV